MGTSGAVLDVLSVVGFWGVWLSLGLSLVVLGGYGFLAFWG